MKPEDLEQSAVIQWASYYKSLRWLHSSLNGAYLNGKSQRERAINWRKLESLGAKKGIHDLFLPVVRPPYHGLYIEMKAGKNRMTDEQKEYAEHLESQGYKWAVCWSASEAIVVIREYMGDKL